MSYFSVSTTLLATSPTLSTIRVVMLKRSNSRIAHYLEQRYALPIVLRHLDGSQIRLYLAQQYLGCPDHRIGHFCFAKYMVVELLYDQLDLDKIPDAILIAR